MADKEKARMKALREFAAKHESDMAHVEHVCELCGLIFDAAREFHKLGAEDRALLQSGALIHDVGFRKNPPRHHKIGRDIIAESKLAGFTPREVMIFACMARYHRRAFPDPQHRVYCDLDKSDRALVDKLSAILRLADGLDRSHTGSVKGVRFDPNGKHVRLTVRQSQSAPVDIQGGERKADLFEHVFKCKLEIVAAE